MPKTYWAGQLDNVSVFSNDGEEFDGAKMKITGNGDGETKWVNLTPVQFVQLKAFLLSIETA